MIFRYIHPDGNATVVKPGEASNLWSEICSDEAYEWGQSSNSLGILQWLRNSKLERQLFFSKHPEALWYFEYEDCLSKKNLALYDPNANDKSWANAYMDPGLVCQEDVNGNLYVKLLIGGQQYLVLHACFVDSTEGKAIVERFIDSNDVNPSRNWVDSESVQSRIYQG